MENLLGHVVTSQESQEKAGEVKEIPDLAINFDSIPSDLRYLNNDFMTISPQEPLSPSCKVYTFRFGRDQNMRYIQLSEVYCCMQLSIKKRDPTQANSPWKGIEASDPVAPCFLMGPDSFFNQIDIYLNGRRIQSSDFYRHIRQSMSKRLYFQPSARQSYLGKLELGDWETGISFDVGDSDVNKKREARKQRFVGDASGNAKSVMLIGLLSHGLSSLSSPLLNDVEVIFKMFRNSTANLLDVFNPDLNDQTWSPAADVEYEIFLEHLSLMVRKPLFNESILREHQRMLARTTAKYYFTKDEMAWFSCPIGVKYHQSPQIFSNSRALPAKLFLVFMSQERLQGSLGLSFHRFICPTDLATIELLLDSRVIYSLSVPEVSTIGQGQNLFYYLQLFLTTQTYYQNNVLPLSFDDFILNTYIYAMDLSTASQLLEGHLPLLRSGQLKVRLTFETLTTQSWNCVIWATYPALLEVSQERKITLSTLE